MPGRCLRTVLKLSSRTLLMSRHSNGRKFWSTNDIPSRETSHSNLQISTVRLCGLKSYTVRTRYSAASLNFLLKPQFSLLFIFASHPLLHIISCSLKLCLAALVLRTVALFSLLFLETYHFTGFWSLFTKTKIFRYTYSN